MKNKIIGSLIWCGIILLFVGCNRMLNTPEKPYEPTSIRVDIDTLNEIKDIANDRSRNYSDLLDEISNKIDEIIEHDKIMYEIHKEEAGEARQNFIDEQLF